MGNWIGFNYGELPPLSGRATGGSATTLQDTQLALEPNTHRGYIRIYPSGGGIMYERAIITHSANEFTFASIAPHTVERDTIYEVILTIPEKKDWCFKVEALPAVIPAGEIWHICSGDCWSVNGVEIQAGAILRIDGEVHTWGDVTGTGIITGEGDLRLH